MIEMKNYKIGKTISWNPRIKFHIPKYSFRRLLEAETAKDNVKKSLLVLLGKGDKVLEDTVALNSGAILYLSKIAKSVKEGYIMAKKAIRLKLPYEKLLEIIEQTKGDINQPKKILNGTASI